MEQHGILFGDIEGLKFSHAFNYDLDVDGCGERSRAMEQHGILFGDIEGLKFSHAFNYDLEKYNPFEDAKGYEGPVLIVRGTKDELVDEETCETYLSLYQNPNKHLVHVENANHNFSGIPCRTELLSESK